MVNKKNVMVLWVTIILAVCGLIPIFAAEINQDARRHMFRGQAAMEEAKNLTDYQDAVNEFKQAIEHAPGWADAWFNLGVAQEKAKDYGAAIKSFNKYIELNPNAVDRREVEGQIIKLEYKYERLNRKIKQGLHKKLALKNSSKKEIATKDSYIKYVNGVVLDTYNNLEWYAGPDKDTNWNEAKLWAEGLTIDGGGWRLPTKEELRTIYQKGVNNHNITSIFKTTGWYIWSKEKANPIDAWEFNFFVGSAALSNQINSKFFRGFAVRSPR